MNQFHQYMISNENHFWGYSLFLVYDLWVSTMIIPSTSTKMIDKNKKSFIWSRIEMLLKQWPSLLLRGLELATLLFRSGVCSSL